MADKAKLKQVLAELWAESQGDHIKIKDAGIIQDCVMRVAAAVDIRDYV